jgi:hypothetical protein
MKEEAALQLAIETLGARGEAKEIERQIKDWTR